MHWDDERRLWYADLALNPGASYMPFVRLALVRYQPNALPSAKISKVVLAEFAQVLPRRRAVLARDGSEINVKLFGTTPAHGDEVPGGLGVFRRLLVYGPRETGRNRVELVLQTRDPTSTATSPGRISRCWAARSSAVRPAAACPSCRAAAAGASIPPRRRTRQRPQGELRAGGDQAVPSVDAGDLPIDRKDLEAVLLLEPKIWDHEGALPDYGEGPARLMLREFERYYTDRTVPERRGGSAHRRRVIEERLVYAAIFAL